jgi:hypothetical protein
LKPNDDAMNIFFLCFDPRQAAIWHCDKHVVKMLLESTQLLWTAWHIGFADSDKKEALLADAPLTKGTRQPGYRPTHKNHPCAIWTRATIGNYRWLIALAMALAEEYHYRYPTAGSHACEAHIAWLAAHEPPLPPKPLSWPALAMPPEYKISKSPTACYKAYYCGAKRDSGLLVYTRRELPPWVPN